MATALEGLRVLDLTEREGHLCGRLLADLGAEVIKVEPPQGDPLRHLGPFKGDVPDRESCLPFINLNTNKLGVAIDATDPSGREAFLRLARTADVVIETSPGGDLNTWGVDYGAIQGENPGLVIASITGFGLFWSLQPFQGAQHRLRRDGWRNVPVWLSRKASAGRAPGRALRPGVGLCNVRHPAVPASPRPYRAGPASGGLLPGGPCRPAARDRQLQCQRKLFGTAGRPDPAWRRDALRSLSRHRRVLSPGGDLLGPLAKLLGLDREPGGPQRPGLGKPTRARREPGPDRPHHNGIHSAAHQGGALLPGAGPPHNSGPHQPAG